MATATVTDYVIWTKHVHDDPHLVAQMLEMWPGSTIELEVDGVAGVWRKMGDGRDGRSTPGLRPIGSAQEAWRQLFKQRRGAVVSLKSVEPNRGVAERSEGERRTARIAPPLGRTEAERKAALADFLELGRQGYRSDGPYGPRDELYDRE